MPCPFLVLYPTSIFEKEKEEDEEEEKGSGNFFATDPQNDENDFTVGR